MVESRIARLCHAVVLAVFGISSLMGAPVAMARGGADISAASVAGFQLRRPGASWPVRATYSV